MKSPRLAAALLAALLVVPLAACSSSSDSRTPDIGGLESVPQSGDAPLPDDGAPLSGDGASLSGDQGQKSAAERSVIRNGAIVLQVDDPSGSTERITGLAEDLGGYVESQSIDRGDEGDGGAHMQLRVPADRLDEALRRLSEVGSVVSQSTSASDVTAEHVDLQARVKALEASVERLTKLMSGAATTADLLEAESALAERQQQLDGLRAQLKTLEGQVSQAGVSVTLSVKSALPGGPANFWDGLVAGWNSITAAGAGALVLLGILLPWLVLAGVITLVIIWIVRSRRRSKRRSAPAGLPTEQPTQPAQVEHLAQPTPSAPYGAPAPPPAPVQSDGGAPADPQP